MTKLLRHGLCALFALIVLAVPASAQEVIRNFETAIVVAPDASVEITETIEVNAEGVSIRRGIFRDIPTVLAREGGGLQRSSLEVLSVTRDGEAEPYATETIRDGTRIRIGRADTILSRGIHRYQIRYRMDRAARMFADYDELYWNATGNYWEFPILSATTVVTLPEGADITALNVFTGAQGATASAADVERISDRQARFTTTGRLAPYEGMTVSVAFEKGVLVTPQGLDAALYWLSDNRQFVVPAILVALVLAYNALAWNAVGRDPAKGVIFPRFYPPKDFSPALTHYVHRMGWANSGWLAFSAALIALATKGLVTISKTGQKTVLTPTGKTPEGKLPPGEAVIYKFLDGQGPIKIDTKTGPSLVATRKLFTEAIETENRAVYFNNHVVYVVMGIVLGVAALGLMVLFGELNPIALFFGIFAAVFISILATGLRSLWQGPSIKRLLPLAVLGIFIFNAGGIVLNALMFTGIDFPTIAAVTIVVITLTFGILMRAPTVHGRKVMDEIDGFKMYLETAEKERLNFQKEPDMTVARFEAILPYAMALGVEKPWSERFQNDLARHAVKDAPQSYSPLWYSGGRFSSGNLASTMGSVATGLSAAMVAAQPAPAASSGAGGSRGGGFSGGGGGGGGGGGW
jgi:hypothetical protein